MADILGRWRSQAAAGSCSVVLPICGQSEAQPARAGRRQGAQFCARQFCTSLVQASERLKSSCTRLGTLLRLVLEADSSLTPVSGAPAPGSGVWPSLLLAAELSHLACAASPSRSASLAALSSSAVGSLMLGLVGCGSSCAASSGAGNSGAVQCRCLRLSKRDDRRLYSTTTADAATARSVERSASHQVAYVVPASAVAGQAMLPQSAAKPQQHRLQDPRTLLPICFKFWPFLLVPASDDSETLSRCSRDCDCVLALRFVPDWVGL